MNRPVAFAALFAALVVAAGCGKKPEPPPEVAPATTPHPVPAPPAPAEDPDKDAKAEAVKRLKQIGMALYNFESAYHYFPAGIAAGPKLQPGLSWRVQILPQLGKEEAILFERFKLEEPWDSEHNKALVAKMPKVFETPGKPAPEGKTYLRSFSGETAFIPAGAQQSPNLKAGWPLRGRRVTDISDGTSNTFMVVEAAEPVEWTKPDELPFPGFPFDPKPPVVPKLGGPFPGGFHALMCDGSAHFLPSTLGEKTLRAMIGVSEGEVLPKEATDILFPPKPPKPVPPTEVPADLTDAAARKTAVANYQKILLGLHLYNDVHGYLPAGHVTNKAVGLSWRVQLLPYLDEVKLYSEFRLNEPWDSEHNKALVEKMPKVFESPGKAAAKGHTFLRTTLGPGGIIPTGPDGKVQLPREVSRPTPPKVPGVVVFAAGIDVRGRSLMAGIPDGTSNTILLVEAAEASPWTKPDDLYLPMLSPDPRGGPPQDAKLPPLGGVFADGFHAVMADGRVTFFKTGYPAAELAKLFCPADGWAVEPLGEPGKIAYSVPLPVPTAPPPVKTPGKGH